MITKMISGKVKGKFTKIATTDYDYSKTKIEELEKLEDIKQESLISKITIVDNSMVEILASVDNSKLEKGSFVRAIGIYIKEEKEEKEMLYAVSIETKNLNYTPAFRGKIPFVISYKLITEVHNSNQIIIEINPAATPTTQQVELIEKNLNEHTNNKNIYVTKEEKEIWKNSTPDSKSNFKEKDKTKADLEENLQKHLL